MSEKINERKVRVVACILGIDKTQDDEMIYRYIIPTTLDTPRKIYLPGGYIKEGMDKTESMLEYVKEQLGFDVMEASDNQAILGFSCYDITTPSVNSDQDVIFVFPISIQLQYFKKLMKDPNSKLSKRTLPDVDDEGNPVEDWAFDWFDPEDDPRKEQWINEWEKDIVVDDIKEKLGEDFFDFMDDLEDDEDEDGE